MKPEPFLAALRDHLLNLRLREMDRHVWAQETVLGREPHDNSEANSDLLRRSGARLVESGATLVQSLAGTDRSLAEAVQRLADAAGTLREDELYFRDHYREVVAALKVPRGKADLPEYASARVIARHLGLELEATRKRLDRLAEKHDCTSEVEGRRSREARKLYHTKTVIPLLESRP
jgi:hypothetical protein